MLQILKKLLATSLSLLLFTQTVFASEQNNWLQIDQYSQRQDYLIDKGELCKYLVDTYVHITKTTPAALEYAISNSDTHYILQAKSLGIIDNSNVANFSPTDTVTKSDIAIILYHMIKMLYPTATMTGGENIIFPDKIENTANIPLQFLYSRGIIKKQRSGTIKANENLTLKETTQLLYSTFNAAPEFPIVTDVYNKEESLSKKAYLTFDDGISTNTITILDTLKKYNLKASFFITGKSNPEIVARIVNEGHTIGNHTLSHDYSAIYKSSEAFWADFNNEQEFLQSATGETIQFIRFPGGSNNTVSIKAGGTGIMSLLTKQAKEMGYLYVDWNVSSGDAAGKTVSKTAIVNNVLNGAKNKQDAVILMHQTSSKTTTAEALPEIIEGLQNMGFEIVPLTPSSILPQFIP